MQLVRRLYLYLISGITLGVIAVGIELLAFAVLRGLGVGGGSILGGDTSSTRVQLSQAVALIAVGLPVWLVHWWLVERGLRSANPNHEAERTSAVRAIYLTLVLTVTLLVAVNFAASFLRTIAHSVLSSTPTFGFDEPALALPATVVSAVVWLYHWLIHRRDLRAGPLHGSAAWLPRLYLYGAAALGFISALGGIGDLIRITASRVLPGNVLAGDPGFGGGSLVDASIGTVLWAAVWLGHWWYLARTTRGSDPQALDEARSRVRLVYFIGIGAFAATRSLLDLVDAGRVILASALGAESILGVAPGLYVLARATLVPVLTADLWAWAAWIHLRWLRAESRAIDEGRSVQVERLRSYGLSLVGLAVGATGLAGLLGLLLNLAFGRKAVLLDPASWRLELAGFVPLVILGSALWLWQWRDILKRQAADRRGEALSTTRRAALLLPVAVAIVAGLGSAVLVLYRLVAALLGAVLTDSLSDLAKALGILVVAAAVAGYHGLLLRRDLAIRAEATEVAGQVPATELVEPPTAEAPAVEAPAVEAPAVAAPIARRELVLSGPAGSDLESVVATLRGSLPAGHALSEAPAEPT
jgi:hypothetical protein